MFDGTSKLSLRTYVLTKHEGWWRGRNALDKIHIECAVFFFNVSKRYVDTSKHSIRYRTLLPVIFYPVGYEVHQWGYPGTHPSITYPTWFGNRLPRSMYSPPEYILWYIDPAKHTLAMFSTGGVYADGDTGSVCVLEGCGWFASPEWERDARGTTVARRRRGWLFVSFLSKELKGPFFPSLFPATVLS